MNSMLRLATVLVLAVGVATASLARQGDTELTEHDVQREYGYVPMKDGVRLAYVVWRPGKRGRLPAVFHYSPFGSDGTSFDVAKRFLEAGYAFVGVNMRGTGCSQGVDTEGGGTRPETVGRDGATVVEWIAARSWSTGNVGMVGTSYAGGLQLAVAANAPPHLKAIVPAGISANDYRESYMPGGMVHLGGMASWALAVYAPATGPAVKARIEGGDTECAATLAKRPAPQSYQEIKQHPLYDDWWRVRSQETIADRVTVPTLILMGWQDEWNLNAGTHLFKLLQAPHKKIILQNGGHWVGVMEGRHGYRMDQDEAMRWLDRWVKGEDNGIDKEPPVTVFWEVRNAKIKDGSQATPGWKTTYAAWPAPDLQWTPFYLTADGTLSDQKPAASTDEGARSYLYPAGTELVGDNTQFAMAPYDQGSLAYRTQPLAADMTILGLPRLAFSFSSEQKDTDFMFTLKDVDPAGNTLFLQRAYLRASMRALDEEQSTQDEIVQSFRKVQELVPGQIYDIQLSIPALGHVVRKGHRLELSILAPNAIPAPVMGGVPVGLASVNKVYHSSRYPASLVLPVVPGEKAMADPPPCGSLLFQPCRQAAPVQ